MSAYDDPSVDTMERAARRVHATGCLSTPSEYDAFVSAACTLRDAELAMRAAQEKYREALAALNRAVAPVPK